MPLPPLAPVGGCRTCARPNPRAIGGDTFGEVAERNPHCLDAVVVGEQAARVVVRDDDGLGTSGELEGTRL
jgi:hypothetical protein